MIELIDQHIADRLSLIKFGDTPVTVYPYIPFREHDKTSYPSIAFQRHGFDVDIRSGNTRPNCDLFIPNSEQITVDITPEQTFDEQAKTGPVSYTKKPFPTPITLHYEIQTLSTEKTHADRLVEFIVQSFPPGYMTTISGQSPLFIQEKPLNLDDLSIPLFKTSFVLSVADLWLDRLEAEEIPSIQRIDWFHGNIEPSEG
jgi:hypothetical protein